jgi:type II secretory pathway predicted ATPase ExeA
MNIDHAPRMIDHASHMTDPQLAACLNHWGARAVPFSNADHEKPFLTPCFEQALGLLQQTAALRSVMILSGANGVGKSALAAHWIEHLEPKLFRPIVITQATLSGAGLLCTLLAKLGQTPRSRRHANLTLLEEIIRQMDRIIPLLVLDEAQLYRPGALDEIRLLLGLNLPRRPVFALILIGDTYFLDAMRLQSQRALYSRIAVAFNLEPLDRSQVADYITHALCQVGIDRSCVEPAALDLIAAASDGLPRTINLLGRMAWIEAARCKANSITPDHVQPALHLVPSAHDKISTPA